MTVISFNAIAIARDLLYFAGNPPANRYVITADSPLERLVRDGEYQIQICRFADKNVTRWSGAGFRLR